MYMGASFNHLSKLQYVPLIDMEFKRFKTYSLNIL